ncbi:MAG: hypothetical protein H6732_05975 [Alphaproteobacteria bacterium]|nr:hypothetical protein [Alphaproteobacteria bacterium]
MPRIVAVLLALLLAAPASAYDPANRDQLWYSNAVFGRINPLGLIDRFRLGYRRRLEVSDNVLGRDAFFFVGLALDASPAFGRIGVHVEAEPVALFRMGVTYQFTGYFGSFDQIASFPTADADYSDSALERRGEAGLTAPTYGHVLNVFAQPKFKIGPIAMRDTITVVWQQLALPAGDTAWYDQVNDRLSPNGDGVLLLNDADVLGVVGHAVFGARYTYTASFFPSGSTGDGVVPHHRLGPLFAYTFHNHRDRARWDRPTLFALVQWWLQHPYRTGQDVHQGLPLMALGLAFEGDLLWKGPPAGRARRGKHGGG